MTGTLLMVGTAVLLVTGILALKLARGVRRAREMRGLARRMGWRFQARPSMDVVPDRRRFGLFTVRMHQRMANHLSGVVGGYQVAVFDLEYASAGDSGVKGSGQTVVHVRGPRLALPAFSLRPERVFHRAGDRVGGDDIDIREDPAFSRAYHLVGRDEDGIRYLFDAGVRDVYHRHPGLSTDADGGDLLVWRRGELVRGADVPALVQTALDIAALHGRAVYELAGRTNGNHTPHIAARLAERRRAASYDDPF